MEHARANTAAREVDMRSWRPSHHLHHSWCCVRVACVPTGVSDLISLYILFRVNIAGHPHPIDNFVCGAYISVRDSCGLLCIHTHNTCIVLSSNIIPHPVPATTANSGHTRNAAYACRAAAVAWVGAYISNCVHCAGECRRAMGIYCVRAIFLNLELETEGIEFADIVIDSMTSCIREYLP